MKKFTFSDLSRRSGDVLDAALAGPVSLVKRGKAKLVLMPAEDYERLVGDRGRTAHTLDDAPAEDIAALVTGFRAILDEAGTDAP